ncbi:hypothetical protein D043_4465B, partial [Vibrio parahaemolyticus EKP-021]
TVLEH